MVSEILICPECRKQFEFNCTKLRSAADMLSCPHCGKGTAYRDFRVVFFCPNCRNISPHSPAEKINGQLCCPTCHTVAGTAGGEETEETLPDAPVLPDNSIFDKYRIIKLIGKGGMSEVYQAEHLLLQRIYALKIMKTFSGSTGSYKRFLREAQCFHQLRHKNIVRVYDIGCDLPSTRPFIAMEYIEGTPLTDEAGSFTTDELLHLARDMAKALEELHKNKIVHRDIKPSNIMRSADGNYLLMDLGIAKAENSGCTDFTLTVNQAIFGTPVYASAEQCQSPHTADHRSDIYSLGATLYHLASGKLPYSGNTPLETVVQVIQSQPEPLAQAAPSLPAPLAALIECMMDKSPDRRPRNATVLLTMLNTIEQQIYRGPVRRSKLAFKITITLLLLLGAAGWGIIKLYSHNTAHRMPPPASSTRPKQLPPQPAKPSPPPAAPRKTAVASPASSPQSRHCRVFHPSHRVITRFARQSRLLPGIAQWQQSPVSGWQCNFGQAAEEAKSSNRKLLILTCHSRFFLKFMQQKPIKEFLPKNFVLLFINCDLKNMPQEQIHHIHHLRTILRHRSCPSTTILNSDGSFAGTIPAARNHRQDVYFKRLEELMAGRKVHFDSRNEYIGTTE